jgi:hypothetical protein
MNLKKTMAATAIAGAFGFTALGLSAAGVARAEPISPATPGTHWAQDDGDWWGDGDGWGHGHWHGGWGHGWGHGYRHGYWGPGYGYGYGHGWYGGGVSACVSATGPWGYVTGSVCI